MLCTGHGSERRERGRQARGREGGYEAKKLAVGSHDRVTFADILICRDM